MEFFAPYAIDDLMHFTRMGSLANVVLPLLMLAAFVGQIFFMLRGGEEQPHRSREIRFPGAAPQRGGAEPGRRRGLPCGHLRRRGRADGVHDRLGRGGPHRGRTEEEKVRERPLWKPVGGTGDEGRGTPSRRALRSRGGRGIGPPYLGHGLRRPNSVPKFGASVRSSAPTGAT